MSNRIFISYLNDDNRQISGYVELIEKTAQYLSFKTNKLDLNEQGEFILSMYIVEFWLDIFG